MLTHNAFNACCALNIHLNTIQIIHIHFMLPAFKDLAQQEKMFPEKKRVGVDWACSYCSIQLQLRGSFYWSVTKKTLRCSPGMFLEDIAVSLFKHDTLTEITQITHMYPPLEGLQVRKVNSFFHRKKYMNEHLWEWDYLFCKHCS